MIDRDRYRDPVVQEEIDGIVYTSSKLSASRMLVLMARTARVVGHEGLQALVLATSRSVPPALYLVAIQRIVEALADDPGLPRDLCAELRANRLRPVGEGRVHPAFDAHFAGEMPHLFEVLLFVLRHNLLGFTLGSLSLSGSPTPAETATDDPSDPETPSEESSPQTSTR